MSLLDTVDQLPILSARDPATGPIDRAGAAPTGQVGTVGSGAPGVRALRGSRPPGRLVTATEVTTVVVGAGPAGLFAALRAQTMSRGILVVDAGLDVADRLSSRQQGDDERRLITSGFGGAGLFSDGKLCLSHRIGSTLSPRFPPLETERRQRRIDRIIRGGEQAPLWSADSAAVMRLEAQARERGLEYLHYPVRHVGSDQLPRMLHRLRDRLAARVGIECQTRCVDVHPSGREDFRWEVTFTGAGPARVHARNVVLAPGKVGSEWLTQLGQRLDLPRDPAQPKIGFRLEGPREFLKPLLDVANDPKVIWRAGNGAEVRTHCVCYGGDVVPAGYRGLLLVGGHSKSDHLADRSNCAVIATAGAELPLSPVQARSLVAEINSAHGGQIVVQPLAAFLGGEPASAAGDGFTPSLPGAAAGDLAAALPAPIVGLLRGFLQRLGKLCPLALRPENLLYGPAVERWAERFVVTDDLRTPAHPGLYLAGDGPGLTGGIIGAAESGWLAGEAIAGTSRTADAAR
jgi:uncharacterized protein